MGRIWAALVLSSPSPGGFGWLTASAHATLPTARQTTEASRCICWARASPSISAGVVDLVADLGGERGEGLAGPPVLKSTQRPARWQGRATRLGSGAWRRGRAAPQRRVGRVFRGGGYDPLAMPDEIAVEAWVRRNEAVRAEDRRQDLERSMSERLEEAVRLSRMASELEANLGRDSDVRTG